MWRKKVDAAPRAIGECNAGPSITRIVGALPSTTSTMADYIGPGRLPDIVAAFRADMMKHAHAIIQEHLQGPIYEALKAGKSAPKGRKRKAQKDTSKVRTEKPRKKKLRIAASSSQSTDGRRNARRSPRRSPRRAEKTPKGRSDDKPPPI